MWVETHRCGVEGCPNLAAYEVVLYDFDPAEGAVVFAVDDDCPALCVEHALENERGAEGERRPGAVVRYPYTNRCEKPGLTIYRPLRHVYAEERAG
jgi:hypothetical protein